jgi:hypothetical protein
LRKVIITAALVAVGSLSAVGNSSASLVQRVDVKLVPVTGSKPANSKYVKIEAYLTTRQADSTRGTLKANPVGKVFMDFPAGSTVNSAAKPACRLSEYAPPDSLARVPTKVAADFGNAKKDGCSTSAIGTGWALLNSGAATAHRQLTGAAPACAGSDATQYTREWAQAPANGPDCTPVGDYFVKMTAYQGAVLKAQWWCYGDAGAPAANAPCNNKATGGDAKNTLLATGPKNGTFNDLTNKKGKNGCNIIFANNNSLAPLSFGGTATDCKNRLTVIIPALNGCDSCLGELTGGLVLSDFYLNITATNYLKAGPAACKNHKMTVTSQIVYSRLKGELVDPDPKSNTPVYENAC